MNMKGKRFSYCSVGPGTWPTQAKKKNTKIAVFTLSGPQQRWGGQKKSHRSKRWANEFSTMCAWSAWPRWPPPPLGTIYIGWVKRTCRTTISQGFSKSERDKIRRGDERGESDVNGKRPSSTGLCLEIILRRTKRDRREGNKTKEQKRWTLTPKKVWEQTLWKLSRR